jgi:hypothetical protein
MTIWLLVLALVNGVLALITLRQSRRSWAAGTATGLGVLVLYVVVLMLWPDGSNRHSLSERLLVYGALAAITWLPGAASSIFAGRLKGWSGLWVGIGAISVSVACGAAYPYTAIALFCQNWGECP